MKTVLLMFFFCLTCSMMSAQSQWINTAPLSNQGRLEDLHFVHPDTGWVVSGGGEIFHTNDGGESWDLQYTTDYYLRSIAFADNRLGFAGTLDQTLLKTENGGITWTDVSAQLPIVPSGICGMQWLNDQTIVAVGAWFNPAFLLRSDDRGENWIAIDMNEYAEAMVDVHFVSSTTGFACGKGASGGVILYTTDGGYTWEERYTTGNPGDYVWKLQFIDDQHVVASTQTFGASSWMPYSMDGGLSWEATSVPYGNAQGIGFITPEKGWIGGYDNGFYATEDRGDNWDLLPFGGNYNRFQVFDTTLAYASGDQVYKYADTTAVISDIPFNAERQFDPKLQVSPNPASGPTLVSFQLPRVNNVDLNLYDQRGALIQPVFNGRLPSGTHSFELSLPEQKGYFLIGLQVNEGLYSVPLLGQ
jgi:photosystem II stability/assembly factor-like uncharacterized protein